MDLSRIDALNAKGQEKLMTTQVITELNQIIQLLEAEIPANPGSPQNVKLAKSLEKDLADYFKALEQAFPFDALEQIYYKHVARESFKEAGSVGDAGDLLDPILAALRASLLYRLNGYIATIYIAGTAQMVSYGKTKLGLPVLYEGPPIQQAIDFAREHCAKLVTQMDDETKTRLSQIISDGIQNKRGVPGLARDIRKEFEDMTKYRSNLIATSETRDALFHASQDRMEDMGVTGKEWVLGAGGREGNCADCRSNAAVGVIPIGDEFPIPQNDIHPGCTCAIAPSMIKGEK